jgi:hypothetical protein
VSLVAPLREIGILGAVILGVRAAGERGLWPKLLASLAIVAGAAAVALG